MGVLLLDENKLDGMNKILHHFMEYVPALTRKGEHSLSNDKTLALDS